MSDLNRLEDETNPVTAATAPMAAAPMAPAAVNGQTGERRELGGRRPGRRTR